jgi:hypothetical protein
MDVQVAKPVIAIRRGSQIIVITASVSMTVKDGRYTLSGGIDYQGIHENDLTDAEKAILIDKAYETVELAGSASM